MRLPARWDCRSRICRVAKSTGRCWRSFPPSLVHRYGVFPLGQADDALLILTSDPFDLHALDAVSAAIGQRVTPLLALPDDLDKLIKSHLGVGAETIDDLMAQSRATMQIEMLDDVQFDDSEASEMAQQASVVRLVNEILDRSGGHCTPATFTSRRRSRASRSAIASTACCSVSRRRRR